MFKRIDHIELLTADPQRTIDFYTRVLGFKVRARDRVPQTPMGPLDLAYLELGGTTVELMCYPEKTLEKRTSEERLGYRMMALEVEDMDRALAQLKAKGIEPSWGPVKRPTYARAEIRDPDGNAIELRQWLTPASRERS
jgi:catechol 2,3-dioxygenase-like lactoylglutathione lyase family enzyme